MVDGLDIGTEIDARICSSFRYVLEVIDRRGNDLAGIGDGTEQLHGIDLASPGARSNGANALLYNREMSDQRVAIGQRPTMPRQDLERFGNIQQVVAMHDP